MWMMVIVNNMHIYKVNIRIIHQEYIHFIINIMHLFYYINLIVLPLATLVFAQQDTPFYITSPLQGTVYKAGET